MRELLYIATSDWHAQPGAWTSAPANQIRGDAHYALQQIVDLALERKAPILAAGDLFDVDRPDSDTLAQVFEQMSRLQQAGIHLLYTQGQHERASPPYLSLHPWPDHIHDKQLRSRVKGRYVYGMDHRHVDLLSRALTDIPGDADILVCHQVWSEFMGVGQEGSLTQIPFAKTVLTGDFHQHLRIQVRGATTQEMTVLSPGATCLQDIAEPAEHAIWLAYDDGAFESHVLKSRQVFDIEINSIQDLEAWLAGIAPCLDPQKGVPEHIAKNIIYVRCQEAVPDAYRRVFKATHGKAHLFWKAIRADERPTIYEDTEREQRVRSGLVGCLDLVVPEGTAVYKSVSRILGAADPASEIVEMRKEFGAT